MNGCDVLKLEIKEKDGKEKSRAYKFLDTHQTTSIKFYDYNPDNNIKILLVDVPIDIIVSNSYSLNYAEYITDENINEVYGDGVEVKTLGEICHIIKGAKKRSKDGTTSGLYPLYYCSILGYLYLNTFDYTGEGIIINKTNGTGKAMVYYGNNKYNVGETTLHFKSKINELQTKYIYYYLFHNIELLQKYFKGANQKSIVEEDLFKIKIPIPALEKQQEIVKYLDFNDTLIKQLEKEIDNNKRLAQQFITGIVKSRIQTEEKYVSSSVNSESINEIQLEEKYDTSSENTDIINEILLEEKYETSLENSESINEEKVIVKSKLKVKKVIKPTVDEVIIDIKPMVKKIIRKVKKPVVVVVNNEL